ncbi:unnamed protein product [Urochloa humidicola]
MLSLEHWSSPRSVLHTIFDSADIPSARVKIANELVFLSVNEGKKELVTSFQL